MRKLFLFSFVGLQTVLLGGVAAAQVTPSDVRDLVGARAAGAESELAARGYVAGGGRTGDDRKWTYWWNDSRGVCLSVVTMNGRYDSIVSSPAADCRESADRDRPLGAGYRPDPPFRPDGGDYREHIALICYGEGEKLTNEYRSGYEWDSDKRRYKPRSGYELTRKDYETSVTVQIDGDRGRVRPAKNMLPPLHSDSDGGWYDISRLSVSRDMIRGEFKLNGLNKPKMTIDRRTGHIVLDGLTQFKGQCAPLDGDRRF